VLTPQGRVSRYLYGLRPELPDVGLALREPRLGRGGATSIADRVLLTCFRYNPTTRKYEPVILGVMRGGSALFALILAAAVALFARHGRLRRAADAAGEAP
jgi:protein SCO1/2